MIEKTSAAEAFRRGYVLHIFCVRYGCSSGQRLLRVVRWELDGELVGYGQGPELSVAWDKALWDLSAPRPYGAIYGPPNRYAGHPKAANMPDHWITTGGRICAYAEGKLIKVELRRWDYDVPHPACVRLVRRSRLPAHFTTRGIMYKVSLVNDVIQMQPVNTGAHLPFRFRTVRTASAVDLLTALRAAFKMAAREVYDAEAAKSNGVKPLKLSRRRKGEVARANQRAIQAARQRPTADTSA